MNFHEPKSTLAGPLYLQVSEILRRRINRQEWPVGHPIPNEADLSREVGVSKGTLRKALELLEDDRLIVRRQGRGTFVAQTSMDAELARFSNLSFGGERLRDKAVSVEFVAGPVTVEEARLLNLMPGSPVHRFNRTFRIAKKAAITEVITLPKSRFQDIGALGDLLDPLLFTAYRNTFDIAIVSASEAVSAVSADVTLAELLGVPPGTPLLKVQRIAEMATRIPVELSVRHIHLDGAKYEVRF